VELKGFTVQPVDFANARHPSPKCHLNWQIEKDLNVRLQSRGGQLLGRPDGVLIQLTPSPLIGQRRIGEPVSNYYGAALKSGTDNLADKLGAGGSE
jgi:hypothetical protein